MRTLNDLSKQYHMSKMTFQRRMASIPNFKSKFCERGKYNKLLISDKGVNLINYEKHDSTSKSFHTKHGNNSGQLTKTDLVKVIHHQNDYILNLKAKNNRLRNRNVKQIKLTYHGKAMPTPKEWDLQLKVDDGQHKRIKYLEYQLNHMSFGEWLMKRFRK